MLDFTSAQYVNVVRMDHLCHEDRYLFIEIEAKKQRGWSRYAECRHIAPCRQRPIQ